MNRDVAAMRDSVNLMQGVLRQTANVQDLQTLDEVGAAVMQNYDERHLSGGITGVPTSWETFDIETGGYQNGDLIMFVARPGMGKTWLLIQQAPC